ncbi:MAG: response regulator [Acidobacteria bacterium]|nr:response regulator [Acidobacteriota bacterium]MCA1641412.1 response regulator [Acidobacteriota bacterium]
MRESKPRILFVDNHEDTRLVIITWLGVLGYEVRAAESGAEGLRMARQEKFDLYLLDSRFADGTGRELCEKLREFDPETPIIFYSGETPQRLKDSMECDAQGYVIKPEFDALPKVIEGALNAA